MIAARRFDASLHSALLPLLKQPGKKLTFGLRRRLEAFYEIKLGDLCLVESSAPQLIGARAFACGNAIFFAPGQMNWNTRDGIWLLGHEIAHVKQQSRCAIRSGELTVLNDSELEAEADLWGDRLARMLVLEAEEGLAPSERDNCLSNVLQCFAAFATAAWYLTAPVRLVWNSLPSFRSGATQDELNQQNIDSGRNAIVEQTALTRQNGSEVPLFIPPPVQQPQPLTVEEQVLAIHRMTLAENMARLSPMQLLLRNTVLQGKLNPLDAPRNPSPLAPPTAQALNRGIAGLQHVEIEPRPEIPDIRGIFTSSLNRNNLQHVNTKASDFQRDTFPQLRQEAIESKQLDFHSRVNALKTSLESIKNVLPDPIIRAQCTTISTSYKAIPTTGDDVILAQLNAVLRLVSELEARVKESLEITNLLNRQTASGFFDKYFSDEINSWSQLLAKLDEKLDTKPGSNRVCPLSYATWESIINEYNGTPRDKSRIIMRLDELVNRLNAEALTLKFGKAKTYFNGFTRQLSGGTGASWDCRITITENAWNAIEHGDGNPEQIRGILTSNPIPIQKDGTTKGSRAIKPEPYGWIFSTSSTLRLTSKFPNKKLNWPPKELVFDSTENAH